MSIQTRIEREDEIVESLDRRSRSEGGGPTELYRLKGGSAPAFQFAAGKGRGILQKRELTIGHADLTSVVNGESMAFNIGSVLPAGAVVLGHSITGVTGFSGGAVSALLLDIGVAGSLESIVKDLELITDAPTASELEAAVGLRRQDEYGAVQLVATFDPDAGNPLADLTAGSVTIKVFFAQLA